MRPQGAAWPLVVVVVACGCCLSVAGLFVLLSGVLFGAVVLTCWPLLPFRWGLLLRVPGGCLCGCDAGAMEWRRLVAAACWLCVFLVVLYEKQERERTIKRGRKKEKKLENSGLNTGTRRENGGG